MDLPAELEGKAHYTTETWGSRSGDNILGCFIGVGYLRPSELCRCSNR